MTTVYLIRHSVRMKKDDIVSYNTTQNDLIKNEKIILSPEGEKRALILSNEDELQNIDVVYASNCVRTLATAKYLLEKQNLKVSIDERFDERRAGKPNGDEHPNWFSDQYFNSNYKTIGGESQLEVRKRFEEALNEALDNHMGKRIAIFTHGYAITFFLLKYCKLLEIHDKKLKYEYNGKILFDKSINAPEVFKLIFNDKKELEDLKIIEFEDLPFNHGV